MDDGSPAAVVDPVEVEATVEPVAVEAVPVAPLRVISNYAYYDDDGLFRAWPEGAVVTDPDEIQLLTGRGAPVERADL